MFSTLAVTRFEVLAPSTNAAVLRRVEGHSAQHLSDEQFAKHLAGLFLQLARDGQLKIRKK